MRLDDLRRTPKVPFLPPRKKVIFDAQKQVFCSKMKTKGRIKPSKPVSFGQMVGGAIFAVIGLTVMIPLMKESGGPVWFGVIWTLLAVSGALIGAYNLFSEEGIATDEFSYTSERLPRTKGIQSRLRELNELKAQGLISDAEYQSKRSELLGKI